jgi:hypothetical protein
VPRQKECLQADPRRCRITLTKQITEMTLVPHYQSSNSKLVITTQMWLTVARSLKRGDDKLQEQGAKKELLFA